MVAFVETAAETAYLRAAGKLQVVDPHLDGAGTAVTDGGGVDHAAVHPQRRCRDTQRAGIACRCSGRRSEDAAQPARDVDRLTGVDVQVASGT